MKTSKQKKLTKMIILELFLIILVIVGLGFYVFNVYSQRFNSPPQITISESNNVFSVNATKEDLLAGVSATDKEDGDVTESIVIESISPIFSKNTRTITYVAFDSNNNVTKLDRDIKYKDYKSPKFICDKEIHVPTGDYSEILSKVSVVDVIDGNISNQVKIEINNVVKGVPGKYAVQLTVTNSCGDVVDKNVVVVVTGEEE